MSFDRAILHLDLDSFFVSVERLHNSALRGKPLLIGGKSGRSVVSSASYEARKYGVHAAMPMRMALRLCPDAIVLNGDMERYSEQSRIITEIIREEAPLFEKASIDEFYLDLSGMDKYIGTWQWSKELRQRIIKESGLPISSALSINKLISKIGVDAAKPNGDQLIIAGQEKDYIAPMSVRKIPSVGIKTQEKLHYMGVRTIKVLRDIPPALLKREFGKNGLSLWNKANAIDNSPVVPFHEQKSMSTERTFREDSIDVKMLKSKLSQMVQKLAFELRSKKQLTANISIKLRYADFNTFSKQKRIPYTASDRQLTEFALGLFDQLYQRRQLVRLIGVRFSNLVHGNYQISIFDDTEEEINLLKAMDRLRQKYGASVIRKG